MKKLCSDVVEFKIPLFTLAGKIRIHMKKISFPREIKFESHETWKWWHIKFHFDDLPPHAEGFFIGKWCENFVMECMRGCRGVDKNFKFLNFMHNSGVNKRMNKFSQFNSRWVTMMSFLDGKCQEEDDELLSRSKLKKEIVKKFKMSGGGNFLKKVH